MPDVQKASKRKQQGESGDGSPKKQKVVLPGKQSPNKPQNAKTSPQQKG